MFNHYIRDEEAAANELVEKAKRESRAPNQPSAGNATNSFGGFTNLIPAPPDPTGERLPLGVYPDEIGIDPDGNFWKPFFLGVDTFDDEFAYIPTGYPVYDYGS